MRRLRSLAGLVGVAALSLAGCGGEGSDGGGRVVVVPPPSATATPTPTPQTPTPTGVVAIPAPFGLTADRTFALLGFTAGAMPGSAIALRPGEVELRWQADVQRYHLAISGIGAGLLVRRPPGESRISFAIDGRQDTAIILEDGRGFDPGFNAVGLLSWFDLRGSRPPRIGAAAFGIATAPSDIATSGTLNSITIGITSGDPGNARIDIDYASGAVGGDLGIAWVDDWGPYTPTRYPLVRGRLVRDEAGFTAEFDIPGAPTGGALVGRFFGPAGREFAISWTGWVRNPYTEQWERTSDVWIGRSLRDWGA